MEDNMEEKAEVETEVKNENKSHKAIVTILIIALLTIVISYAVIVSPVSSFLKDPYYESFRIGGDLPIDTALGGKLTLLRLGYTVVVKVTDYVPDFVYSLILMNLKVYNMFSDRVYDIYRNNGGTITMELKY